MPDTTGGLTGDDALDTALILAAAARDQADPNLSQEAKDLSAEIAGAAADNHAARDETP
jgi:hypothetical protein